MRENRKLNAEYHDFIISFNSDTLEMKDEIPFYFNTCSIPSRKSFLSH
jgi:hypothetical protein